MAAILNRPIVADYLPVAIGFGFCAVWLRADLGITIGTGVSAWADQSGSGNSVTQATGSAQPTLVADAYNGKPTLRFAIASSQFLAKANTDLIGTGPYSVLMVEKDNSNNNGFVANTDTNTGLRLDCAGVQRSVSHSGVAAFTDSNVSAALDVWTAVRVAASKPTLLINGSAQALAGAPTTIVAPGATASLIIGARNDTGVMSSFLDGDLPEVAWYTVAISDSVAVRLNKYAQARYAGTP